MKKTATTHFLLVAALGLPVAVFWFLFSRLGIGALLAALVAIASGWAMNLAWAVSADPDGKENYRGIAMRFGWVCPAVLVLIAWAVLRFVMAGGG